MHQLVKPILNAELEVDQCLSTVKSTHDFLVDCSYATIQDMARISVTERRDDWATTVKRIDVRLPQIRPDLVASKTDTLELGEVLHQCATMERLLNALQFARETFPEGRVTTCYPITNSSFSTGGSGLQDNDLVIALQDGQNARFEVFDTTSHKDSAGREKKGLIALNVLLNRKGSAKLRIDSWPADRLFMVVSEEFASRLANPKRNASWLKNRGWHCRYQEVQIGRGTAIFEVVPGWRWDDTR